MMMRSVNWVVVIRLKVSQKLTEGGYWIAYTNTANALIKRAFSMKRPTFQTVSDGCQPPYSHVGGDAELKACRPASARMFAK